MVINEKLNALSIVSGFILFPESELNFFHFSWFLLVYDVIGHDEISQPVVWTDSSGLGLYGIKKRLVINGPQKM